MECEMPKFNAADDEIKKILDETKTIAVIGLSPNESKDSHRVAKYLKSAGYKIIPVYPATEEKILGEKVYRTLSEITERVDLVDVFRKPEAVPEIVDEILKRKDIKTLWLQLGIIHNAACQKAQNAGLQVVQNRCTLVEHRKHFG